MRREDFELVKKGDARFCEALYSATDKVCATKDLKIVRLSGPTCAGKTTAAKMIVKRMAENGKHAVPISIDDFYYDCDILHEMSAKKGLDTPDYDSPDTINVEALARFINDILTKGEAYCPVFDFNSGKSDKYRKVELGENDILLLEGIQAVYPQVLEIFGENRPDCIFIAPLDVELEGGERFEPNEIRLMRRIVRDDRFRGTSASETMKLWENVRANEEKNIFPYVADCKYRINSSMPYDLGVLKPHLEAAIGKPSGEYREEFEAMLKKISRIEPISSDLISDDSLYREFV